MLTNEQSVVEAEKEISSLKEEYMAFLTSIVRKYQSNKENITLDDFLKCQQLGNKYFNYVEQLVGDSGLLGAHSNGKWVTGFAETCHSVLEAFIEHITFLRSWKKHIANDIDIEPSKNAYANMQRMVSEYLSHSQAIELKNKFIKKDLPITGFISKGAKNIEKNHLWKDIVAIIIAIIFIITIIYFTIENPNPSNFQIFIFRGLFSLALSLLAFLIPGLLNVESKWNQLNIKATGAIALFIIVWLINPPALIN